MDKYLLIPLLPLIAFAINIIFGKGIIKERAHWIAILAVLGSFIISVSTLMEVLNGKTINYDVYSW
ncbi:MAG: NADH-quinone oxidoreductase subunit L, partial [Nitrospirota bacterium]